MVFLWCLLSHEFFYRAALTCSRSRSHFVHIEQREIRLCSGEDDKSVESHRTSDITEAPLHERSVVQVDSLKNPMLGPDNLGYAFDLGHNRWDNLCSGT